MLGESRLSSSELTSLAEVANGFSYGCIPAADGARLLELDLIFKLLGENRVTIAGRKRLALALG
jgi:hypothetical protein